MAEKTPPFCCPRIQPQSPFHKQAHYPRSYTCLLDFLALATSLHPGRFPPTDPLNPLDEHGFVVRLCKGHTNPQYGANQWGPARYFLPDSSVKGGLIEVLNVENGEDGLESLRSLLGTAAKGGTIGGFLHLEDVWMTVLCPVHTEEVWFLQFWVKGPRDSEELGVVKQRVRDRASGKDEFVEDEFTVRFHEMMGIPRRPKEEKVMSPQEARLLNIVARGLEVVDAEKWCDQAGEAEQGGGFQGHPEPGAQPFRIPPGLPPQFLRQQHLFGNSQAEDSHSPVGVNAGTYEFGRNGMLDSHEGEPENFLSRNQPYPFHVIGDRIPDRGYQAQDPPLRFLGTALQWEDPSLRTSMTSQPFSLQPPQSFPYITNHRPTMANTDPWRAQIETLQTSILHSPQPARNFAMGGMWQSPKLAPGQPANPPTFLEENGPSWELGPPGPGPYDFYQPEQPMPPIFPRFQDVESGPPNHNQGDWGDFCYQAPVNSTHVNRSLFSPPHSSLGGPLDTNDSVHDIPVYNQHEYHPRVDDIPTAPAVMRDTSVAGQSAYAPPAGNTTGLRPVPRRTWDIAKKEWRNFWIWAL